MIEFLVDQNFNEDIVDGLTRRDPSLEFTYLRDVGLADATDPAILEWAATHGLVLLTHDRKTIPPFAYARVAAGLPMPGVLLVSSRLPITSTKATAIYNMHTYWSKKPHDAIRQYIRHFTQPGDIVLDPFCGSGGTALAALMEGRKAIAIDRSPAATFITKNYCTPVDPDGLQAAFEQLGRAVQPEMDWLYETRCDRYGGKATTGYTVYSQVFQCPRCMQKVPLFDCIEAEGRTQAG